MVDLVSPSSSCPTLQLRVAGQTVNTDASTEFKHLLCSEVTRGMNVRVRGNLQSGGSILASRIVNRDRKDDDADDDDDDVEVGAGKVEGIVSNVTGICPRLTIKVGIISPATVTTTLATEFDDIQCSAIKEGVNIEAVGATQADGSLEATKIEPRGLPVPVPTPLRR